MSDRYDHYTRLSIDRPAERVLRLTMDEPERLNAADEIMHRELCEIWRDIDQDPEVSVAILTGAGGTFSSGGDMDLVESMASDFETLLRVWKEARDLVYNVINCSKPVVSAMEGVAVGAGLSAGLVADVSIVAPNTRIIDGHTRLGVAAGDHSVIIWPLLCGMAKAKYYLLTCKTLKGEEAERIGLVSLCVPEGEVQDTALEVASELAQGAPTAIRFTKYALNNWLRSAGPAFDTSTALEMLGFCGPEVQEGLRALREKRAPRFDPNSPV
ncbi:MAG: enoyl-CoA hydratase/isomerase family protein [Alphaproteobacteria bacterium]|nr:enoyl-CoA hydratase/isomerase family protein [Alphaproteobacteria bacterium]